MIGRDAEYRASFEAAVRFIADQPGGAERTLAQHHRLPDGTCAGCLTGPSSWPCTAAVIAQRARRVKVVGSGGPARPTTT
jgi:hypothetical protein